VTVDINRKHVGIIGGGAWGTALAATLHRAGREVTVWAREPEVIEAINRHHVNSVFLPGIPLNPKIRATADLARAANADIVLLVVPAQHTRSVCRNLRPHFQPGGRVIICTKGIETGSLALMSEVVADTLGDARIAVLSGPTFAAEVAHGMPSAATVAAANMPVAGQLAKEIGSVNFRLYHTSDVIGVQIGGAVKNVIAIACGIANSRGYGKNTSAALITRGLAEMARLGAALGASRETLMGLSGVGDLLLTCGYEQSRNLTLGIALGRGAALDDYLSGQVSVAEGVASAAAVAALAVRHEIDMPIVSAVDAVLNHGVDIDHTIAALLARQFIPEAM